MFLPTNSSEAELKILHKAILRGKQCRLLLTLLGIPTSKPTKACEDNESVVHSVQSHHINPRLLHVDNPTCYLHHEHVDGLFETKSMPSRIKFGNMGTKLELGPRVMCSSSIAMGHAHVRNLPKEQHDQLVLIPPISCYNHFLREQLEHTLNILCIISPSGAKY